MTADLLEQARAALSDARVALAAGLHGVAAREAYLAMFHAAQAVLREREGRAPKTHSGVHGAFGRIAKDDPRLGRELGALLADGYDDKQTADDGDRKTIGPARAAQAVADAERFLAAIEAALAG